jgi:LacI family transcriptional regulator
MRSLPGDLAMTECEVLFASQIETGYGRGVMRGVLRYTRQHPIFRVTVLPLWMVAQNPPEPGVFHGFVIQFTDQQLFQAVMSLGAPTVNVGDAEPLEGVASVLSDHVTIGRMGAEHLMDRGFRHFGFYGAAAALYSRMRHAGFREWLCGRGLQIDGGWLNEPMDTRYEMLTAWVAQLPLPVGVMAADDGLAGQVVTHAHRLGLTIPDQVAVLGVDDDELLCQTAAVPISSMMVSAETIGYEAMRLLDAMLRGQSVPPEVKLVPPVDVVVRHSTDVLAVNDHCVADAVRYIRADHPVHPTVDDVAAHVGLSRRQLERRFGAALNRSVAMELRRARIDRVKHMIDTTDRTLDDIAAMCNFPDAASLSKLFRRVVGMAPSEYRRRSRLR